MAITPQAIKDQEFQIKFRGYDAVEVKAYLELIAEEFFELLEQVRQQIDEMDTIVAERNSLQSKSAAMQREIVASRGSSEEIRSEFEERDSDVVKLQGEIKTLKNKILSFEEESKKRDMSLTKVESEIAQKDDSLLAEKKRSDKLSNRIDDLAKQNEELRKEEIDFKSTLVAAQQFTDEVKRKTEKEAKQLLESARIRAEKLKKEVFDELAHYPAEIEKMKTKKTQVRDDLEATLKICLENLEIFDTQDEIDDKSKDYKNLFQTADVQTHAPDAGDDYDSINMEFDLPGTNQGKPEKKFSMKD